MVRFFYYTIPCWKSRRVGVLGRGKGFLYLMWFLPRSKGILSPASEKGANRLTRLRPWDGQDTKRASRPFIFQIQHIPFRNLLHLMFLFSLLTSYHGKFRLANKKTPASKAEEKQIRPDDPGTACPSLQQVRSAAWDGRPRQKGPGSLPDLPRWPGPYPAIPVGIVVLHIGAVGLLRSVKTGETTLSIFPGAAPSALPLILHRPLVPEDPHLSAEDVLEPRMEPISFQ